MADVIEVNDLTAASQDGWAVDYLIRREDGEELQQRDATSHQSVRPRAVAHALPLDWAPRDQESAEEPDAEHRVE